ncbi:MAG: CvpA family protein [Myxococcota bacterium]
MWVDALILALIACLAWAGARRGAAVAGVQLIGLPLAYAGAVGAAFAFGPALANELGWPEAIGTLVAGSAGLVVVQLLVSAVTRALRNREADPAGASQALGLVFGAARGALFALPLLWLAGLSEGARLAGVRPELPDLSGARLPALGTGVLGSGAEALLDEKAAGGRVAVQLVSRPAEALGALQQVVSDPRVVRLQRDGVFWRDVERGAVRAALSKPSARALINDSRFRARLGEVGVVSEDAVRDPHHFETELSLALAELGPRLEAVRNDPALDELLADPAVRESLQSGNTLALLGDPRFRALVSRVTR